MQQKPTQQPESVVPFEAVRVLPDALRIPRWLGVTLAVALAVGAALGALASDGPLGHRLVRAVFFASAFAYLTISVVDFWEHGRLERALGGHFWSTRALPLGETINHALTSLAVIGFLLLARRPPPSVEPRDLVALMLPAVFLALGWRDELVYHRRRCAHREDIMHTTAHLAAGVMMCSFALSKMVGWSTHL